MRNDPKTGFQGISSVFTAIFLWGILPVYWKQLDKIPSDQILANRVIWSFAFVLLLLILTGRLGELFSQIKSGESTVLFLGGIIITINWFTYIYAVNSAHIVEASLGYFINPLLTIFLARVVLKEKLDFYQVLAFILAIMGVGIITLNYGRIPVIAFILAFTFSSYSLIKKRVQTEVILGITLETFAVMPLAVGYLLYLSWNGQPVYADLSLLEILLVLGTGVITAVPLILFSYGAQRVPLMTVGFINYLAPTISLFLGIFLYKEPFTLIHILTFGFIWAALLLYSFSQVKVMSRQKKYSRT